MLQKNTLIRVDTESPMKLYIGKYSWAIPCITEEQMHSLLSVTAVHNLAELSTQRVAPGHWKCYKQANILCQTTAEL